MGTRYRKSGRHTKTAQNRKGNDNRPNANSLDRRSFVAQNKPFKVAKVAHFGEDKRGNGRHEERIQSIRIHDSHHRERYGTRRHNEVLSATTKILIQHQPVQRFTTSKKNSSPCSTFCKKKVRQRLDRKQLGIEVIDLIVPQKLSKKHYSKYGILDQEDHADAHIRLVHLHQSLYFSEKIKHIENKRSLALSSKLAKLGPVLVPHQGLRLGPSQTPIQIL
jgi:hypothetical protein